MIAVRRLRRPAGAALPGAPARAGWRGAAVPLTVAGLALAACSAPPPVPATGASRSAGTPGSASGATAGATAGDTAEPGRAKLIEIGWDTPGAAYVRDNVRTIEALPFDGIALTPNQGRTPDLFEDRTWTAEDVQLDALAAIDWERFTDNYLSVRAQSRTGAGWFDEARWARTTANTRRLSAAVAAARARGVVLDPEFYYDDETANSAWSYNATQYPDRDFATVEAQVRRRGAQFMAALQSQAPGVTVMLMVSRGFVQAQAAENGGDRASVQYALVPAFVNGMLDVAGPDVEIVDGDELGYYHRTPEDYARAAVRTREAATLVDPLHRVRYERHAVGAAVSPDCVLGLWTGPDFRICEPGTLSAADRRRLLRDLVLAALRSADGVAWLYNESFDLLGPNLTGLPIGEPPEGLDRQAVLDAVAAARDEIRGRTP